MKAVTDPKKYNHLKAESLAAELLQNGFSFENIIVSFAGAFKKKFRKDIESVKETDENKFEITLNRDGIYDLLPEGLFHQPVSKSRNASLADVIADFRRLREEEKNARKFFQPLENEFLRYGIYAEQRERAFASDMLSGNMAGSFSSFWNLPKDIPPAANAVLMRLFPWAYLIKGNLKLTAKALQIILSKNVSVEEKYVNDHSLSQNAMKLNDMTLGADLVSGQSFSEPSLCWMFTISNILANEMELFTEQNSFGKLLLLFVEIFVPVEIDVLFDYKTNDVLEIASEKILGFGFTL